MMKEDHVRAKMGRYLFTLDVLDGAALARA